MEGKIDFCREREGTKTIVEDLRLDIDGFQDSLSHVYYIYTYLYVYILPNPLMAIFSQFHDLHAIE